MSDPSPRTGMDFETLERAVLDHLMFTRAKDLESATLLDVYYALSHTVRDRLVARWMRTERTYARQGNKRVYYLCAEYLLGRQLQQNLLNLGLLDLAERGLAEHDIALADVFARETDPGLGNGGLGRLAACFMESLATLGYPAMGYGIRYEFGIFRQEIVEGYQIEQPDEWLRHGNPWEIRRTEFTVPVRFGGRVEQLEGENGRLSYRWVEGTKVLGVPYDTPVAGYGTDTVNTLRLWAAQASEQFDLAVFNDGDYRRAVEEKAISESISKVLYPKDDSIEGKELRLKQQYFFVACSVADVMRRFKRDHCDLSQFPDKVALHLNDTHPAIAIAELMRVLMDIEGLDHDTAWDITQRTFAYTNHTLLPEALEKWALPLFERLLPRHLQIIYEINHHFLRRVHAANPGKKAQMSIIEEGDPKHVRMAYLSVVGSHKVNGVAQLHSELLRTRVLRDFAEMYPERFTNKTNGVTVRRWLRQCNPRLADAITQRIGDGWVTDLSQVSALHEVAEDPAFLDELRDIKQHNKALLAPHVRAWTGFEIDPNTLYDVHIKRIHEYKRQLMLALEVVHQYCRIKFHGERDVVPRTVLIGGKAAPGYARAKTYIKLIGDVSRIVNNDPAVGGLLRLHFLPNYNVSAAERIIPAADLSEQISMAGKEASGTGNMKFQMNGALTLGTLDGANIEIREEVGEDNFFLFGLDADQVHALKHNGYDPRAHVARSPALDEALGLIRDGFFSPDDPKRFVGVVDHILNDDPYLVCADFESYLQTKQQAVQLWAEGTAWWPKVARNIASSGKFSSDRTIREYAEEIWGLETVDVEMG